MSRFALDQLFLHGHFVSPAALRAAGLIGDPAAKPAATQPPQAKAPEAKRRKHAGNGRGYAHA